MADEARKLGLVPGFYFKTIFDNDHVEDPKRRECIAACELPALAKSEDSALPKPKGATA